MKAVIGNIGSYKTHMSHNNNIPQAINILLFGNRRQNDYYH